MWCFFVLAIATGWGASEFAGKGSDRLMKVILPLTNISECKEFYPIHHKYLTRGLDESAMLCAGKKNLWKDTCGVSWSECDEVEAKNYSNINFSS